MLLDLGLTSGISSREFVKLLSLGDRYGFNYLWIGEDIDRPYDVFVRASFALMETRMKVGIGITSIFVRNISNVARAAVTLHEMGNDRFRLGIGVGGLRTLKKMGIPMGNPLSAMREAPHLLKRMWNRETVTFKSELFHLERYYNNYGLGQKIPIYFGVRGTKMLKLAGTLADGIILSGPKTYLKRAASIVRDSVEEAGRRHEDFNLVVWLPTIVTLKKEDLKIAKEIVAVILADTPENILKFSKIDLEVAKTIRETYVHEGVSKTTDLITDEILEEMIFYGYPRDICESFLSLEGYSINEVVFGPPFGVHKESAIGKVAGAWRKTH